MISFSALKIRTTGSTTRRNTRHCHNNNNNNNNDNNNNNNNNNNNTKFTSLILCSVIDTVKIGRFGKIGTTLQ